MKLVRVLCRRRNSGPLAVSLSFSRCLKVNRRVVCGVRLWQQLRLALLIVCISGLVSSLVNIVLALVLHLVVRRGRRFVAVDSCAGRVVVSVCVLTEFRWSVLAMMRRVTLVLCVRVSILLRLRWKSLRARPVLTLTSCTVRSVEGGVDDVAPCGFGLWRLAWASDLFLSLLFFVVLSVT